MDHMLRTVELFAGVGGFRVGLGKSSDRFETVWANQWEPGRKNQFAFDCYDRHFGSSGSKNVNEDIAIAKYDIEDGFDLLVGGFPCQDYSVASTNAKGIEGKKGVLWWHIRDIIEAHKPKYVLLENVDRLLKSPTSQRGRDFGIILRCMSEQGYSVEWRVINAADYGMVQRRRRTFIFACRNDLPHYAELERSTTMDRITRTGFFSKEFPVGPCAPQKRTNRFDIGPMVYPDLKAVSDTFTETIWNSGVMIGSEVFTCETVPNYDGPRMTLRDILQDDVPPSCYQDEEQLEVWKYMKGPKKIVRTKKGTDYTYVYSEGGIPYPDPLDRPGRTMLTSEGTRNRSSHLIEDPRTGRLRTLSPEECERMNGFEPGWTEGMTDRQRYFTMGNALVVDLIKKMGDQIIRYETDDRRQEPPSRQCGGLQVHEIQQGQGDRPGDDGTQDAARDGTPRLQTELERGPGTSRHRISWAQIGDIRERLLLAPVPDMRPPAPEIPPGFLVREILQERRTRQGEDRGTGIRRLEGPDDMGVQDQEGPRRCPTLARGVPR